MPTFACIINHYIIVMKRLTYLMLFLLVALAAKAQQAKYVFYFIGDGMGLNQVNTTEMYLGEQQGRIRLPTPSPTRRQAEQPLPPV